MPSGQVSLQWYQMALSFVLVNDCACVCACTHTGMALSVCVFCLFSLFHPLCRHNPSVYEITRAHLCSGGSHLGSEEASAGNHLGSTQSSFHSASPVLSTLWPKLFTLKGERSQISCLCICKTKLKFMPRPHVNKYFGFLIDVFWPFLHTQYGNN